MVYTFSATDKIVHDQGLGVDDITITKVIPPFGVSMQETTEGVKFQWGGSFPEYQIRWYTDCNHTNKLDTVNGKSYLIPYSKLRDLCYGRNSLRFEVSGERIEAVHMLPGYTHNIINLSDTEDLVTLMWANEIFDPDHPDTFHEDV